jgi:hypothetical protein
MTFLLNLFGGQTIVVAKKNNTTKEVWYPDYVPDFLKK